MGIVWRGIIHDLHKLSLKEFVPYARYFYGDKSPRNDKGDYKSPPTTKLDFDIAWNHHQKHSLGCHHWNYHVLINGDGKTVVLPMGEKNTIEMVCDWRGAGKAITGKDNVEKWYQDNRDKMILHDETRTQVEQLIYGKAAQ